LRRWIEARHRGDAAAAAAERSAVLAANDRAEAARAEAKRALREVDPTAPATDADYVFITFILGYLPHGLIGLLVTAFFAAALNSKAAELNALGSSTTVDIYRRMVRPQATDAECVRATRWFTAIWGGLAIAFALSVTLAENLIQWSNIIGSIFYGVMLGIFLVAFFFKRVGGTAVFWGAILGQSVVLALYWLRQTFAGLDFSYLWYNLIGCVACIGFSFIGQAMLPRKARGRSPA
jgi:solute:Na+ symporter, SSS family